MGMQLIQDKHTGLYLPPQTFVDAKGVPFAPPGHPKNRALVDWRSVPKDMLTANMMPFMGGGSRQSWEEALIAAEVDGPPLTNSTTATSIIPTAAKYVLPANWCDVGRVLRITFAGRLSNVVTTPGTLTLDVRWNTTPIIVFNGGAMAMSTTVHTNLPIFGQILLVVRAIGSGTSANLMGQGFAMGQPLSFVQNADLATSNSIGSTLFPNTAPAVGTGFDSTVANVMDFFATFSVNTATTSITLHQYMVEALN